MADQQRMVMTQEARAQLRSNGHTKKGIDPVKRTWTSTNGLVFKLKPVSWAALQWLSGNPEGKPAIPYVQVQSGDRVFTEPNADDPAYKEALQEWADKNQKDVMSYCFGNGVDIAVPEEFIQIHRKIPLFANASDETLRYLFIMTLVGVDELTEFTQAIMSQNAPTEAGIAAAIATFPSNSER